QTFGTPEIGTEEIDGISQPFEENLEAGPSDYLAGVQLGALEGSSNGNGVEKKTVQEETGTEDGNSQTSEENLEVQPSDNLATVESGVEDKVSQEEMAKFVAALTQIAQKGTV